MANATPAAARAGWELFRLYNFEVSKADLSTDLVSLGYGPVSDRMYSHYRSLAEEGYDHYVTINRFDIERSGKPYQDETSSNKYQYRPSDSLIQLTFVHRGAPVSALGRASSISDAGLVASIERSGAPGRLRLAAGDYVRIDFLDPPGVVHGRLAGPVERPLGADTLVMEVEFQRLHSLAEFGIATAMTDEVDARVMVASEEDRASADIISRRLYYLFELIEDARAIVNEIAAQSGPELVSASPPTVKRLSLASPIELDLFIASPIVIVIGLLWAHARGALDLGQRAQDLRKTGAEIQQIRAETDLTRIEARKAQLETQAAALDLLSKAHDLDLVEELATPLLEQLAEVGLPGAITPRLRNLIGKQARNDIQGLLDQGVESLEIGTGESSPNDPHESNRT